MRPDTSAACRGGGCGEANGCLKTLMGGEKERLAGRYRRRGGGAEGDRGGDMGKIRHLIWQGEE